MRSSVLAAASAVLLAITLGGCASTTTTEPTTPPSSAPTATTDPSGAPSADPSADPSAAPTKPEAAGTCAYTPNGREAAREVMLPPATPTVIGEVTAVMKTSIGDLTLTLDADKAPCAVNSFVSLAEQGYFDDTICHRLTNQGIYVLQCGDPSATGRGGPGYSFNDELDPAEEYPTGSLAMANSGPNTNGSQFFMVYQGAPGALAPNYTPFGSFDQASIDLITTVAKDGLAADGVAPKTEVKITSVEIAQP